MRQPPFVSSAFVILLGALGCDQASEAQEEASPGAAPPETPVDAPAPTEESPAEPAEKPAPKPASSVDTVPQPSASGESPEVGRLFDDASRTTNLLAGVANEVTAKTRDLVDDLPPPSFPQSDEVPTENVVEEPAKPAPTTKPKKAPAPKPAPPPSKPKTDPSPAGPPPQPVPAPEPRKPAPSGRKLARLQGDVITTKQEVAYEFGSTKLSADSSDLLDDVALVMLANPGREYCVAVHMDAAGSGKFNLALSDRRARSVEKALEARTVPASSIDSRGCGEEAPVAPNDTPEGRKKNRRTVFLTSGCTCSS